MSDTTDLMGVTADNPVDTSAPAAGAATGTTSRRRRSGTGLEGMVLAELQQVASGLGIRGTARMRKSQLIEVIKEAQAGGGAAAAKKTAEPEAKSAEAKPKRRATSKARTGTAGDTAADSAEAAAPAEKAAKAAAPAEKAEKAVAQQQIEIPGQPASDDTPAVERRRRRATAQAGSPETHAEGSVAVKEAKEVSRTDAQDGSGQDGDGRKDRGERGQRGDRRDRQDRQDRQRGRGKGDDQQGGQRQQQQGGGQRQQ
ncbi:Rho termination factor N-terminal domain-containing protein, partial [Streptomyces sp. NPDC058953]